MKPEYKHSQPGWVLIIVGAVFIVPSLAVLLGFANHDNKLNIDSPVLRILTATGLFCLLFGYKLTVQIKDGILSFCFGIGMFRKKIPLEKIKGCELCEGIYGGWGIHYCGKGWLYNVSGTKAVKLVLGSGKNIYLGTDEPDRLIAAIEEYITTAGAPAEWLKVKAQYLQQVTEALNAANHPASDEIVNDVSSHLDQRFGELSADRRNWEDFQNIITEMGPPSDYIELLGAEQKPKAKRSSFRFAVLSTIIFALTASAMITFPFICRQVECLSGLQESGVIDLPHPFTDDPEIIGDWKSVDFVRDINDFKSDTKTWKDELYLKQMTIMPNGRTNIGWTWTKNWICDYNIDLKAQYKIKTLGDETYLFFPWLSEDVTIRGQKQCYYVLKKVSLPEKTRNDQQSVENAIQAAYLWLGLTDNGEYDSSWDQAAGYFKAAVTKQQWQMSLAAARTPLGKVINRTVKTGTYTRQVPGAPDGQYVIIQFETSFENKKSAVETVTPMLEKDGSWRVSGYYIK